MDDFNLDEVLTIKSEYQPDLNDVPISNGSLGFKRLQKRRKKRRI